VTSGREGEPALVTAPASASLPPAKPEQTGVVGAAHMALDRAAPAAPLTTITNTSPLPPAALPLPNAAYLPNIIPPTASPVPSVHPAVSAPPACALLPVPPTPITSPLPRPPSSSSLASTSQFSACSADCKSKAAAAATLASLAPAGESSGWR
jgi:hypothetical protein